MTTLAPEEIAELVDYREKRKRQNREASQRRYQKNAEAILKRKREVYAEKTNKIRRIEDEIPPKEEPVAVAPVVAVPVVEENKAPKYYRTLDDAIKGLEYYKITSFKSYKDHLSSLIRLLETEDLQGELNMCPEKVIETIFNSSYKPSVQKSLIQVILVAETQLHMYMPAAVKAIYKEAYDLAKVKYTIAHDETLQNEKVPELTQVLKKVHDQFSADSKQFMLSNMLTVVLCRDDLQLEIVPSLPEDTTKNYIVVPKRATGKLTVVLNIYKTSRRYGQSQVEIPAPFGKELRDYMMKNRLTYGSYIFGDKKLGPFITKMLDEIGLKDEEGYVGGFNLFRKMNASHLLQNEANLDADKRIEVAKRMYHSPAMTQNYLRQIMD